MVCCRSTSRRFRFSRKSRRPWRSHSRHSRALLPYKHARFCRALLPHEWRRYNMDSVFAWVTFLWEISCCELWFLAGALWVAVALYCAAACDGTDTRRRPACLLVQCLVISPTTQEFITEDKNECQAWKHTTPGSIKSIINTVGLVRDGKSACDSVLRECRLRLGVCVSVLDITCVRTFMRSRGVNAKYSVIVRRWRAGGNARSSQIYTV